MPFHHSRIARTVSRSGRNFRPAAIAFWFATAPNPGRRSCYVRAFRRARALHPLVMTSRPRRTTGTDAISSRQSLPGRRPPAQDVLLTDHGLEFGAGRRAPGGVAAHARRTRPESPARNGASARRRYLRRPSSPPMNIHEYQAKQLLARFGVPVGKGIACKTADEVHAAFATLGVPLAVVKAQIHAGGRGKAGGVKLVRSAAEAKQVAQNLLGKALVTPQTGPQGRVVKTLYVEAGSDIEREMYLAVVMDRAAEAPVVIAAAEGGVEIEELAAHKPDAIARHRVHPVKGLLPFQARALCKHLGLSGEQARGGSRLFTALVKAFVELDCSLAEINPLIVTKQGEVQALDAKMGFDDNALFRHKDVAELRDLDEEDPKEVEAKKFDLNYIALHGNIGCMVNGAGLAMATMDVIQLKGGMPANFLDVGGGANKQQVTNAFKILLSDANVKGILVNIFGGIMKCDTIAEGVIAAARDVKLSVPLVVRLEGTNVDLGRKLLLESGLDLQTAASLDEAAEKIVAAIR
jgi:succinyl-CoA synthetase beta subunit